MIWNLLLAMLGTGVIFFMLSDRISSKIRNSMYWPIAWVGYLYLAGTVVGLWFRIINGAGIELPPEEVGVPIILGVVFLAIAVTAFFQLYLPYRSLKKFRNKLRQ